MPAHNQLEYTKLCLENIKRNTQRIDYEIIAIDNASTDGTSGFLKKNKIKAIRNRKNFGVAKAWNQGVKKSKSDYVCIINNDIITGDGWLETMVDLYEKTGNAGIISPGTREGAMDYDFENYSQEYVSRMKGVKEQGFFGWCMLIKSDRFRKVGYFDESFGTGIGEDTDFYFRLKKAGFQSLRTGAAFIHHFGSRTIKRIKEKIGNEFEKNNIMALNARWGIREAGYLGKKTKNFTNFLKKIYMKAVYGHLLLEK